MNMTTKNFGGAIEILAADQFVAVPVTVAGNAVVKAGNPILKSGSKTDVASCDGLLLYDVDPTKNPVGAMLVQGVVDAAKIKASCGVEVTAAAMKTVVPGIIVQENTGVNA